MKPKLKGRRLRGKRGSNVRKLSGAMRSNVKMPTCSRTSGCGKMPKSDQRPNSARRPSFVKRLTTATRRKSVKRPNYVKKHSCVKRCSSVRRPSSAMRPKCDKRPKYVTKRNFAKRCNFVRKPTSNSEARVTGMRQGSCAGSWSSCRLHCAWSASSGNVRLSTLTRSVTPGRTRRNGF